MSNLLELNAAQQRIYGRVRQCKRESLCIRHTCTHTLTHIHAHSHTHPEMTVNHPAHIYIY